MIAQEILNTSLPPLEIHDSGVTALTRMDEFRQQQIPVLCKGEYINLISEEDIFQFNLPDQPLTQFTFPARIPPATTVMHILEVVRMFAEFNTDIIAVVNEKNFYQGCITHTDVVKALTRLDLIQNPGGIIVLEVNLRDYDLSEIAQIIETNDAKVMGLYTLSHTDSNLLQITIKVNRIDLTAILTTLNRYDYTIKASFGQNDLKDLLKDRYDSLMNFLNL